MVLRNPLLFPGPTCQNVLSPSPYTSSKDGEVAEDVMEGRIFGCKPRSTVLRYEVRLGKQMGIHWECG